MYNNKYPHTVSQDCTYEHIAPGRDGCKGGSRKLAYAWSSSNGGRLASQRDYPYTQKDSVCQGNRKTNALVGASLEGSVAVAKGEASNIAALAWQTDRLLWESRPRPSSTHTEVGQ